MLIFISVHRESLHARKGDVARFLRGKRYELRIVKTISARNLDAEVQAKRNVVKINVANQSTLLCLLTAIN